MQHVNQIHFCLKVKVKKMHGACGFTDSTKPLTQRVLYTVTAGEFILQHRGMMSGTKSYTGIEVPS